MIIFIQKLSSQFIQIALHLLYKFSVFFQRKINSCVRQCTWSMVIVCGHWLRAHLRIGLESTITIHTRYTDINVYRSHYVRHLEEWGKSSGTLTLTLILVYRVVCNKRTRNYWSNMTSVCWASLSIFSSSSTPFHSIRARSFSQTYSMWGVVKSIQ